MKNLFNEIVNKREFISLVGLGYVGMPIAVSFAKKVNVIGFDINHDKINQYKSGIDPTKEVGDEEISKTSIEFTSNPEDLKRAKFHIVAVPTPVNKDHTPNLAPVISASRTLGKNLQKGSIIVYESTVYPGVTEEICIPILEEESGLVCGEDFKVGYSPERINPGDRIHRLETIVKVVSGMDEETLDIIAKVYELVVDAGVYRAESIKVAEAAKVIENSQRDINIAFMNELSIIFNGLGIDTQAVINAASTKWNFLKFSPGLVGGHCIGVDPYYLTYKAEQMGYHSQVILSGRRINDEMGKYVAVNTVKQMIKENININKAKVAILGLTFKENTPDIRNTKVVDIISELKTYGVDVFVSDPSANADEVVREYGFNLIPYNDIKGMDALIIAVPHNEYRDLTLEELKSLFKEKHLNNKPVLIDVKGLFDKVESENAGYNYWRL